MNSFSYLASRDTSSDAGCCLCPSNAGACRCREHGKGTEATAWGIPFCPVIRQLWEWPFAQQASDRYRTLNEIQSCKGSDGILNDCRGSSVMMLSTSLHLCQRDSNLNQVLPRYLGTEGWCDLSVILISPSWWSEVTMAEWGHSFFPLPNIFKQYEKKKKTQERNNSWTWDPPKTSRSKAS